MPFFTTTDDPNSKAAFKLTDEAREASLIADSSQDYKFHLAAAWAHEDAAKAHRALIEEGPSYMADSHERAAVYHRRQAGQAKI